MENVIFNRLGIEGVKYWASTLNEKEKRDAINALIEGHTEQIANLCITKDSLCEEKRGKYDRIIDFVKRQTNLENGSWKTIIKPTGIKLQSEDFSHLYNEVWFEQLVVIICECVEEFKEACNIILSILTLLYSE